MPSRRDLDLASLRAVLGSLSLIEVVDGGGDFLLRVFGTDLAEVSGIELTGRSIRSMPEPRSVAINLDLFRGVIATRAPVRVWRPRFLHGASRVDRAHSEICLVLPFSENGHDVDRLLTHSDLLTAPTPNDSVVPLPLGHTPR
jgi:hypothetical protein